MSRESEPENGETSPHDLEVDSPQDLKLPHKNWMWLRGTFRRRRSDKEALPAVRESQGNVCPGGDRPSARISRRSTSWREWSFKLSDVQRRRVILWGSEYRANLGRTRQEERGADDVAGGRDKVVSEKA